MQLLPRGPHVWIPQNVVKMGVPPGSCRPKSMPPGHQKEVEYNIRTVQYSIGIHSITFYGTLLYTLLLLCTVLTLCRRTVTANGTAGSPCAILLACSTWYPIPIGTDFAMPSRVCHIRFCIVHGVGERHRVSL